MVTNEKTPLNGRSYGRFRGEATACWSVATGDIDVVLAG
jgi:hypothetical protein